MATRIEKILERARDTLADHNKERWSDDRLLRILDEGQKDLAKQTHILRGVHEFVLEVGVSEYSLPNNVWLITRAAFDAREIKLVSYDRMDNMVTHQRLSQDPSDFHKPQSQSYIDTPGTYRWELDEGSEISALVFDNRNLETIRVYPIPNDDIAESTYEFVNSETPLFAGDELFGVVTAIDGIPSYTINSVFGVTTSLFDPSFTIDSMDSPYGVITSAKDSSSGVTIWYVRVPDDITDVTDELETPYMFDVALKHYVISQALRDDLDTQYRDMAAESFTLYKRELEVVKDTSTNSGVRQPSANKAGYIGAFD